MAVSVKSKTKFNKMKKPFTAQEVEKEAYGMIQRYGKKCAEEEAILIAESYIKDINKLEYYNAEKIDLWG